MTEGQGFLVIAALLAIACNTATGTVARTAYATMAVSAVVWGVVARFT